jgi:hypothetical protein
MGLEASELSISPVRLPIRVYAIFVFELLFFSLPSPGMAIDSSLIFFYAIYYAKLVVNFSARIVKCPGLVGHTIFVLFLLTQR